MAKARLYFDGDNTYIEKQARIYKMVDEIGEKIDNIPGVINDLNSTSETDALSAAMGKELQDQINALSGNFHFLSSWDCTTGLPGSDPATDPYTYQSGDYYIVSNTGSTNYKPHGSSYTHGVASTAVETQPVQMNDWYVYDGSTWILQPSGGAQIVVDTALSTTSTNPVENRVITQALNNKQDTIPNLNNVISGAAAGATALQPGDNITQLTNNAGYQTAGDVAAAIVGKQDTLTAGEGIAINNNVITNTGITCLTGGDDIQVIQGGNTHDLPAAYTELEYIYTAGGSSSGGYIDTGFTIGGSSTYKNTDIALEYIAQLENTGSYNVSGTAFASGIGVGVRSNLSMSYGVGNLVDNGTTMPVAKLKYYINGVTGETKVTNDSGIALFSATATTSTKTGGVNIMIYTYPSSGTTPSTTRGKGFMYEFKILDGRTNEILWHGIPAMRNSDDVVGMYDIIGEQFFTSSGNAFTAGPGVTGCTTVSFTNASGYMLKSSNKLIYATTDTAFNTRDKICTTADGNYTPREGDVLALTFNHGCGVGSPRLDIDGSGLHSISISTTGANAATFWLGMDKISWLFVYDGNRWITWPIKDTLYSAGTGLSLSNGTFTNTQPGPTIGTTAPATPSEGTMWYDTTNHVLKVYNGTEWTEVGSGGGGGSTTWGNIGGILSNQTDLQDALDDKLESTDLIAGDGITIVPPTKKLPDGYTELEYVQTDGNCYFDTGVIAQNNIEVTATLEYPIAPGRETCFLGARNGNTRLYCIYSYSNTDPTRWVILYNTTFSSGSTITPLYKYDIVSNMSAGTQYLAVNGISDITLSTAGDVNIGYSLYLCALNTSGTAERFQAAKIYYCKIRKNGVDAVEYIPCKRNSDDAIGLYDLVAGEFVAKSGSGILTAGPEIVTQNGIEISVDDSVWTDDNVVAGTGITIDTGTSARLPSGYTELEWIQSDGACAIDSGVGFQTVDRIEVVGNFVENLGGFRNVVGCDNQNAASGTGKYGVLLGEGSGGVYYTEGTSAAGIDYVYSSTTPDTNEHTFQTYYANGNLYISVDGVTDYVAGTRSTGPTTTLGIFARHLQVSDTFASSSSKFKMKIVKMWNGSVLMFDGVPCKRNSDNEIGLYDLVSGTFLENENSGTFTAGPVVTFNPTKIISSTVLGFNNLTYDSFTSGTWTANATVTFPTTAKMAFLNWRAKSTASGTPPFACGQVLLVRGLTLVSSFVGGGNGTDYIYGGVGLDSASTYVDYTQASKTSGAAGIDYTIYFFK